MRVSEIEAIRERVRNQSEPLPPAARGTEDLKHFRLGVDRSIRRRASDFMAPAVIWLSDAANRRRAGVAFPDYVDRVAVGHRFTKAAAMAALSARLPAGGPRSVLVQGCWLGDPICQDWMAFGVPEVSGVEIVNMSACWAVTVPRLEARYGCRVTFRQGKVEELPFSDQSFDLVTSWAVYEHVNDLGRASAEAARVLRPGGLVYHSIGPLYYGSGGDHVQHGYDHLLMDESGYRAVLADDATFARMPDPNCRNWAVADKFSFATMAEYLAAFAPQFEVVYLLLVVGPEALQFRAQRPVDWRRMLDAGVSELDLLAVGLHLVLRKR